MTDNIDTSCLSSNCISDNPCVAMPPPYTEEPPAYSNMAEPPAYSPKAEPHLYNYSNAHGSYVYMGESSTSDAYTASASEIYSRPQQSTYPLMVSQQTSFQVDNAIHQTCYSLTPSHYIPTQNGSDNALLQLSPHHIIKSTVTGLRRTEFHVRDNETNKEYIINEKRSIFGLRKKTVIKEVGGPRIIVKENRHRTIVIQRKK